MTRPSSSRAGAGRRETDARSRRSLEGPEQSRRQLSGRRPTDRGGAAQGRPCRRIAKFGLEDPETPVAMGNVAAAYANMGRPAEALPRFTSKLLRSKRPSSRPAITRRSKPHSLRQPLLDARPKADALRLQEKIVAEEKSSLGPVDAESRGFLENLATNYTLFGRVRRSSFAKRRCLSKRPGWGSTIPIRCGPCNSWLRPTTSRVDPPKASSSIRRRLPCERPGLGLQAPEAIQSLLGVAQSLMALETRCRSLVDRF